MREVARRESTHRKTRKHWRGRSARLSVHTLSLGLHLTPRARRLRAPPASLSPRPLEGSIQGARAAYALSVLLARRALSKRTPPLSFDHYGLVLGAPSPRASTRHVTTRARMVKSSNIVFKPRGRRVVRTEVMCKEAREASEVYLKARRHGSRRRTSSSKKKTISDYRGLNQALSHLNFTTTREVRIRLPFDSRSPPINHGCERRAKAAKVGFCARSRAWRAASPSHASHSK